jgi:hypothetical protein
MGTQVCCSRIAIESLGQEVFDTVIVTGRNGQEVVLIPGGGTQFLTRRAVDEYAKILLKDPIVKLFLETSLLTCDHNSVGQCHCAAAELLVLSHELMLLAHVDEHLGRKRAISHFSL